MLSIIAVALPLYLLSGLHPAAPERPAAPVIATPIAFVDGNQRIALMKPDGSEIAQITNGQENDPYLAKFGFSIDTNPQWAADGEHVYFLRRYGESITSLCEVDASGEGFEVVMRNFPAEIFALSPNGQEIAYGSGGGVHVMNIDGSTRRLVARFPHLPNGVPIAWSPDGTQLAFVSWQQQLWTVELSTGRRNLVSARRIETVTWAPSPQITVGILGPNRRNGFPRWSQVWTIDSDGSGPRRVTDQGSWIPATWSPDASQLLVGRLDHRLRDDGLGLVSATGTTPQMLNSNADAGFGSWRPGS